MLGTLKRLFAARPDEIDLSEITDWAKRRSIGFKRAKGGDGFVIDGALEGKPWRIEWGPPQRDYIAGHELRLRMELDLPSDLQMLVLSRPLMESLERQTFEEFTDNVQTQIGIKTPEEMRWLVMYPKINLTSNKTVRANFGAVASQPVAGLAWLDGVLANMLEHATHSVLAGSPPFVLMTLRGRVYMRMQLAAPHPDAVAGALALFETSVIQAVHASLEATDRGAWHSTATTAWQSLHPDGPPEPRKRK